MRRGSIILLFPPVLLAADYTFEDSRALLKSYCYGCHRSKSPAAGLDLARFDTLDSALAQPRPWSAVIARVKEASMPPKGMPAPSMEQREKFTAYLGEKLRASVCAAGITPGPAPLRRLKRNQYTATLRDVLNIP